ncbi:FAD-dependent monooxygenase [Ureibacillus acetophenoni]
MALIDGYQLSLFTQAMGYVQIGWNIEEGSFPNLRKQPFNTFIEKLIKYISMLEESVNDSIQSWNDFVLLDVHSNFSEHCGNGVAFLGDAVDTMTPTGAFGLNSAMKDADCLAQIITPDEINRLDLMQCESERKREIEKLQAIQIEKEKNFATQFVIYS